MIFFLKISEALKAKNLNAKFLIGKALFLTPFKGSAKPFFNIMSGLSHRPDQIYLLWKFTFGGPKIILRSIYHNHEYDKFFKCFLLCFK